MRLTQVLVALVLLAGVGCGPTIAESRLASYRPRAEDCELGLVETNGQARALDGKWRVIGYVTVDSPEQSDPLARKNRELVRARICQMGGIAVTVAIPGMAEPAPSTKADVTYAALRPAQEPAPDVAQKF